jgi:glycerophosphoryl diester phosphodiesterase
VRIHNLFRDLFRKGLLAAGTPTLTSTAHEKSGQKFPQAIAHRGYNANYPENSMTAFAAAVAAGADALETDIHLSKDSVVVLSHVRFNTSGV